MRHGTGLAAAIIIITTGALVAQESSGQMDSEALRRAVAGRTVHLSTPLGSLPINYRLDGTMSGRAGILASYTGSERDRGRWWVVADKLCQRWNRWLDAKSYCFKLRQQDGRTVQWTRNDGVSGVATIAR